MKKKVFYCTDFAGVYSVGVSAVVVADNKESAVMLLENKLREINLPQKILPEQLVEISLKNDVVEILNDGDY